MGCIKLKTADDERVSPAKTKTHTVTESFRDSLTNTVPARRQRDRPTKYYIVERM